MKDFENVRFYIGPMSKNIVDSVINFCNSEKVSIGLIPSRRQIEYNNGYVNGWNTHCFSAYVRNRSTNVILQRDHGGPHQGSDIDDGKESYTRDVESKFDLIHIDPWKKCQDPHLALQETIDGIRHCESINSDCLYEVGTEQAIFQYSSRTFEKFLKQLKEELGPLFEKIKYAVVQSGTGIQATNNTGIFDKQRFAKMIKICKNYGLLSKEHNGDYLTNEQIKTRFDFGLDAINIAPEFGVLETKYILYAMKNDEESINKFFELCYESKKWEKWLTPDFVQRANTFYNDPTLLANLSNIKNIITEVSGHYVFSSKEFAELKQKLNKNVDTIIQGFVYRKLKDLQCTIK